MKFYRVSYYVDDENGSHIPCYEDFSTKWRAKLQAWVKFRQKGVSNVSICCYVDKK